MFRRMKAEPFISSQMYQHFHFLHCHHNRYNFQHFDLQFLLQFTPSNKKHFLQDQLTNAFWKLEGVNLDMEQLDCTKIPSEMEEELPQKLLTLLNNAYTVNTVYTAFTAFTAYTA